MDFPQPPTYIARPGEEPTGPYTVFQIISLYKNGMLTADTMLWSEPQQEWQLVADYAAAADNIEEMKQQVAGLQESAIKQDALANELTAQGCGLVASIVFTIGGIIAALIFLKGC
ncbi:MAG: DUF4339 domain-containing protein [Verrucomicrobiales bacterium]|jgi:hypothetical protein|nr:DUF4339 domain-containing protein [Verrucomicrobiales bacterium]